MLFEFYLALRTPRVMLLWFGPFRTVKRLVSDQIVHGSEFDAARGADELDADRWRGRARGWWTVAHRRLPCLAVMLLMSDKILVSTEHDIAFLAPIKIETRRMESHKISKTKNFQSSRFSLYNFKARNSKTQNSESPIKSLGRPKLTWRRLV